MLNIFKYIKVNEETWKKQKNVVLDTVKNAKSLLNHIKNNPDDTQPFQVLQLFPKNR